MQATPKFIIRTTDASIAFALLDEGEKGVEYKLYDTNRGMSIAANLREAFLSEPLLKRENGRIVVTVDAPVLLIPIDDYDENQAEEQYKYAFPDTENVVVYGTELPALKTIATFAVNKDLVVVLSDHFTELHFEPIMAHLWDFLMRRNEASPTKKMYLYFHEGKMEVCSFLRRRFTFANTFKAESEKDITYFTLGAWQQINAKGDKDELIMCGRIPQKDVLSKELGQYIERISCIDPATEFDKALFSKAENMPLDLMMQFL